METYYADMHSIFGDLVRGGMSVGYTVSDVGFLDL